MWKWLSGEGTAEPLNSGINALTKSTADYIQGKECDTDLILVDIFKLKMYIHYNALLQENQWGDADKHSFHLSCDDFSYFGARTDRNEYAWGHNVQSLVGTV